MLVLLVGLALVEHGEHLVEAVVDLAVQTGYLYDDAVVRQTAYERVGQTARHYVAVVVFRIVLHVEHRLLDVAYLVAQNIDRYHRQTVSAVIDVALVLVLHAQILAEAERLSRHPRLLDLYQHLTLRAVLLTHPGSKVHAVHREVLTSPARVLMGTRLHAQHVLLQ